MTQKVGVFGLGSMGFGMAQSILRSGMTVYGFDLDAANVERLGSKGGLSARVADVGGELDAVVVVVLNAAQVESVLFGKEGVVPHLPQGALVVACATVPPNFARDMECRCEKHDVLYFDAPISGGSVKVAEGKLSIMASGRPDAFAAAEPVLSATAETVFRLGDAAGAGSAMKAVNQLLAGVHIATMAEAMTFGMTQGVDPSSFVDVISKCAGTSWMLENRAPHIVAGDYTPHSQVNIWPKDLGILIEAASSVGFDAPIATPALDQYKKAVDMGLGGEDDAAVAKVYAHASGLTLPDGNG